LYYFDVLSIKLKNLQLGLRINVSLDLNLQSHWIYLN